MLARAISLVPTLALALALGPASSGCGASSAENPSSHETGSSKKHASDDTDDDHPKRGRMHDKDDVSEEGKSWGGWRWKGKSDDCYYVVDNKCFAKKSDACKAASCGKTSCRYSDAAPSKVSCRK